MDSKKQNRKVTIFAILLSLVSIGVLVFGFTILSSDKVVMLQSVSNIYNKVTTNFDSDGLLLDMIASNKEIGIKATTNIVSNEDKYVIKTNYLENSSNKNSLLEINSVLNDEEIVNGKVLLSKNNLYANFLNITDNYYYDEFDYKYIFRSLSSDDCDKVLALLKSAIDSSISNKDIKKEKVTIKYNGKDKKVNKLTYIVNKKELHEMGKEFLSSLKNDKDLMKNIAKALGLNVKDLNIKINELREEFKKADNKYYYSYSTYYYGFNKIVQYDFYDYNTKYLLSYKEEKEKEYINIKKENDTVFELIKDTKKNTFEGNLDLTVLIEDERFEDYKNKYHFTGSHKNNVLKMTINDNTDFSLKTISDETSYKYVLTIKKYEMVEQEKKEVLNLKSNIELYFNEKIDLDDIELDEAKKYSELTEEEINAFKDRLNANSYYDLYLKKFLGKYFE